MSNNKIAVFCDFDGTVASCDVGYNMFHHFSGGRNDELLPDWKAGILSSRDILTKEAEMVHASSAEICEYLEQFTIDETFIEFEWRCRGTGVPLTILSEGLDLYIHQILGRYGLGHIKVVCNKGHLENDGLRIEFPYTNHDCRNCGSCKGERIREYRKVFTEGTIMAFVGDGYSDACAAKEADVVFAKKDLEVYCHDNDIPFNSYETFADVAGRLGAAGLLTA